MKIMLLTIAATLLGSGAQAADLTIHMRQPDNTMNVVNVGRVREVQVNFTHFINAEQPRVNVQYKSRVENTAVVWNGYWTFNTVADAETIKARLLAAGSLVCQGKASSAEFTYHITQCWL